MFCALLGQDITCAFTGPLVLWSSGYFTDRSKAALLMWFSVLLVLVSVTVPFLCVSV